MLLLIIQKVNSDSLKILSNHQQRSHNSYLCNSTTHSFTKEPRSSSPTLLCRFITMSMSKDRRATPLSPPVNHWCSHSYRWLSKPTRFTRSWATGLKEKPTIWSKIRALVQPRITARKATHSTIWQWMGLRVPWVKPLTWWGPHLRCNRNPLLIELRRRMLWDSKHSPKIGRQAWSMPLRRTSHLRRESSEWPWRNKRSSTKWLLKIRKEPWSWKRRGKEESKSIKLRRTCKRLGTKLAPWLPKQAPKRVACKVLWATKRRTLKMRWLIWTMFKRSLKEGKASPRTK